MQLRSDFVNKTGVPAQQPDRYRMLLSLSETAESRSSAVARACRTTTLLSGVLLYNALTCPDLREAEV